MGERVPQMPGKGERDARWAGGYVRVAGEGRAARKIFVIRRMIGGSRFEVSTKRSTETAALIELERFEKNPIGYTPLPELHLLDDDGPQPLRLDAALAKRYLTSCKASDSLKYWRGKQKVIAWWVEKLAGKDLRKLDLASDIVAHVPEGTPGRQPKIAVLKHFFSWMRDVQGANLLTAAEDPTLDRLRVPQSTPEQSRRPKTFSAKNLKRAIAELEKLGKRDHADALRVLGATGWHVTELDRLARGVPGTGIESLPPGRKAAKGSLALLTVHKVGAAPHRTEVSANAAAAARRLISRGGVPANLTGVLRDEINPRLGLMDDDRVMPGCARHSVATAAVNAGESIQDVANFLGHKSPATTRRFYAASAVAKKVRTMS